MDFPFVRCSAVRMQVVYLAFLLHSSILLLASSDKAGRTVCARVLGAAAVVVHILPSTILIVCVRAHCVCVQVRTFCMLSSAKNAPISTQSLL